MTPAIWLLQLAVTTPHPCQPCHPKQVAAFVNSPMARSIGRPESVQGGSFFHAASKTLFTVTTSQRQMVHRMSRGGPAMEYPVSTFIGSGHVGRSFGISVANRLFQSPLAYFTAKGRWGMSPGYENDAEPEFNRPITAECLFCHAGSASPLTAIGCARCHGDPAPHLLEPAKSNIINPARLRTRARDSICEQCHLAGEARILQSGRSFWEFKPGHELESVVSVFINPRAATGSFKVVSHSEQLAASACARASGDRLWCGTCHDAHGVGVNYRQRCLGCHDVSGHSQPAADCVGCHMKKRPASDGAHTVFTDHRIALTPARTATNARLAPWKTASRRDLGLAYISVGQRDGSPELLNEGFRILTDVAPDPDVLTALGYVLMRKGRPAEAARMFAEAARQQSTEARHYLNLGVAQLETGNKSDARKNLERATELDPLLEDAYRALAEINGPAVLRRYRKLMARP